ncbi:hypothetical protein GIB67_007581 [Kingdonia uniflora]|uniref:Uncharacterized protein n=1 Tax=Kingdonia uniflora TaxID=39325 RepID=A0A7J7N1N4_9MAGN|nr:hypothetical protein GIB67_007581 [Kingdonia uniflora]
MDGRTSSFVPDASEKARQINNCSSGAKGGNAGCYLMKNRYGFTRTSWITGGLRQRSEAAGEIGQKAKERVGMAEEKERRSMVDDFAIV